MPKFNRQRMIFGLYLLVLIAVAELIVGHFKLPAWPAFLAMIFFFAEHMDIKKARRIIVGGTFGIALLLLARPIIGALAPAMGLELARLTFILGLVYAIVAFGEGFPMLFNNYAFMSMTVAGVALQAPEPNPILWMVMSAVGGSALIAGVVLIGKIMRAQASVEQPTATAA